MDIQSTQPDTTEVPTVTNAVAAPEQPWHAAYPAPRSEPKPIDRHEVLRLLKTNVPPEDDFVLVDLRRTDFEGGTIQNSINVPAQSLRPTIPALYSVFSAAGIRTVIWYCGSSRGRGTRAASWFADYLEEQGDSRMQSLVLSEGIKGWVSEKGEFVQHILEYDETKW